MTGQFIKPPPEFWSTPFGKAGFAEQLRAARARLSGRRCDTCGHELDVDGCSNFDCPRPKLGRPST